MASNDDFLSQILGGALGGGSLSGGGLGGIGGGLGGMLGSVLGGNRDSNASSSTGPGGSSFGGGALVAMLLPLAMQWMQRNGGVGAVLDRFRQQGHGQQVASWVGTGQNEPVSTQAIGNVVGGDELSRMARQLGVSNDEVAGGMAQILPQVVNHLTPEGEVPADVDNSFGSLLTGVEQWGRTNGGA